jgi:hypothetical protein
MERPELAFASWAGDAPRLLGQLHEAAVDPVQHTQDRSDRSSLLAALLGVACPMRKVTVTSFDLVSVTSNGGYKRTQCRWSSVTNFAQSRCPVSDAPFFCSSSTMQTGEALLAHTFHHRHHTVMMSVPSTTPPYLARPGRQSRWCAARVHLSEASPLAALDRIGSRGGDS